MPTYAYRCKDCDHAFDAVQSFTDESLTVCPECGGTLRKQFGAVGVSFKGSGFYRTDSRSGGSAAGSGSSTTSSSGSTASPSGASAGAASSSPAAASSGASSSS